MPNINAFQPVVHKKKIFEDFSKLSLFCPLLGPKRGQPLYLNKSEFTSPKHVSYQVWLKLALWFLRRSRLKKKVDAGRTDGGRRTPDAGRRTLRHGISSHGLRPDELINTKLHTCFHIAPHTALVYYEEGFNSTFVLVLSFLTTN